MASNYEEEKRIREFVKDWTGHGYEKGESQKFWLDLLARVLGVKVPGSLIQFEEQAYLDHTSFIDGHIPSTHTLIEQKSLGKSLTEPIRQSDGTLLTPAQQAQRYAATLPYSERPRWIVTCNFESFYIYDMEHPREDPDIVYLKDLARDAYKLRFLVHPDAVKDPELVASLAAGDLVGRLYDALRAQYKDPDAPSTLKSLNVLCVRLVFCFWAEDAGIFGRRKMFSEYLESFRPENMRRALIDLFQVLDTKEENRDPYMEDNLAAFPYVNGGLFRDEHIEIPRFNEEIRTLMLHDKVSEFDWSQISPTIFGAVFESTLNPETRRSGGMHYTSIQNIHKVIDPLFLDDLKAEFEQIKEIKTFSRKRTALETFQQKLAGLTFLDPACGSGNFLTETFLSLRELENEVIWEITKNEGVLNLGEAWNPIKVSIQQFYGIEINDFAVTVAKTALWISEEQMMRATERIINAPLNFLPLKSYVNIVEGNALRIDWETVVPKEKLNYIMGNPPFVGGMLMMAEQKKEIVNLFKDIKGTRAGELDYVCGWYLKAMFFIKGTHIECAFVSTNSITQGQQAIWLWEPLLSRYRLSINFAYRTFNWDNEAENKAHVHCVIIGFADFSHRAKMIYSGTKKILANNINSYLMDAPDFFIESRSTPLCDVPFMYFGSMPRDGGSFTLTEEEKDMLLKKYPFSKPWIHEYVGATEFIRGKKRWCLWLLNAEPNVLRKCPFVMKRIEQVRDFRLNSKAKATQKFADTPSLFCQIAQPYTDYILVPSVSSKNRRYIPIGFMSKDVIASNAVEIIPEASLYHFGILTSNVHMAWMRTVCGRLKSDYRYSKDIVYNNFPWPTPNEKQKAEIERTAQGILDARALYPDASLADLYDEVTMPVELRKAHQANDRAVMRAYGFPTSAKDFTESDCVAALMKLYQQKVAELESQKNKR